MSSPDPQVPTDGDRKDRRRMIPAELDGKHTHSTVDGRKVTIVTRDGKYIARGRHAKKQFGILLGTRELEAVAALRRLLISLEDGTFVPPSERSARPISNGKVPKLSLRGLIGEFLAEKQKRCFVSDGG